MNDNPASYLVGIDDTDNLESRGTGYQARRLGALISEQALGTVRGISRHQLLVSPEIPYTSHNSAACIGVDHCTASRAELIDACREFLLAHCADGSDAGLCVATRPQVSSAVSDFGRRAQREVLTLDEATALAPPTGMHLEGLTGDHGGQIGALSAVGLRAAGDDGRFIWVEGLRERADVRCSLEELMSTTGVESVETLDGDVITAPSDLVDLGPWPRPILRRGRAALLVEKSHDDQDGCWRVLDRAVIKQY